MKYMKTKLKALSPIIATILLVVVAVILVSVILSFGKSFTAQGLDKTKDIKELSKSDAEHFIYPKTFSNGVIQFNYSPPNNSFGEIQITKYKILYDDNETEVIELSTAHTLNTGTNLLNLEDFSDQNVTSRKFTLILETADNKCITLKNITNPYPYAESEEEGDSEILEIPDSVGETPINGEIWYLEHLAFIDTNEDTRAANYTLMRDLNFLDDNSYYEPETYKTTWTTGEGWNPIGNSNQYIGDFDGDGFAISNLYINRPDANYIGLFGNLGGYSRLINLKLLDVNVLGNQYVGSLAGISSLKRISLVNSTGFVSGNNFIGGLIGLSSGTISKSFSNVSVLGKNNLGGLVGVSDGRIQNSYSLGNVTSSEAYDAIAGFVGSYPYLGRIINCYSTGQVIYAGSTNPTNSGFTKAPVYRGSGNFWDVNTSGQITSNSGATGKTTTQMKTQSTFTDANWDFTNIWDINEGITYPYLKTEYNPENIKEIAIYLPLENSYENSPSAKISHYAKLYNPTGNYTCVWNSSLKGNYAYDCNSLVTYETLGGGTHIITVSVTDEVETLTAQINITLSVVGCAFVYSFDGEKYNPEHAMSDFAVHKAYEYPTYGVLNTLKNIDNHYKVGIWEKVPETEHIDTLELWKIIHPKNTTLVAEQTTGEFHTIANKEYPVVATGTDNQSYLSNIKQEDDKYWVTNMDNFNYLDPPLFDELYLQFPNNYSNNGEVKLVVKGKDTGLLSSDWRAFVTLLEGPDKKGYDYLNSENDVFEDLTNYIQNTGLLYVYQKIDGQYQLIDSFRFGNVEFYHTWALKIRETEEPIELKLVGLPYAHQIDEVYIDRSIDEEIEIVKIKGNITETNTNFSASEIKTLVNTRDYNYFKLDLGDYILLDFYDDSNITLTEEQTYTTLLYADAYSESYSLSYNEKNIVNKKNIDLLKEIISTDTLVTKMFTKNFYENNILKTSLPSVYKIDN